MDIKKYPKQANMPKTWASVLVVNMAKTPLLAPNRASIIQMKDKIYGIINLRSEIINNKTYLIEQQQIYYI